MFNLFKFILGFADMDEKENITFDGEPIGPMPKGYCQALILGMICGPFVIAHFWHNSAAYIVGFMAGVLYPAMWTHINWLTYYLRTKNPIIKPPI